MATKNNQTKPIDETNIETEDIVKEAPVEEKPKKQVVKKQKKFDQDDMIDCRSVTVGELILIGKKTGLRYVWADYGDVTPVSFGDLQSLQSMRSSFLMKPRFLIEDEDAVELWASTLKPLYEQIEEQSIDAIFKLEGKNFENAISKLPVGIKDSIKTKAAAMIKDGELYDIRKIKSIDNVLGTQLMFMINP